MLVYHVWQAKVKRSAYLILSYFTFSVTQINEKRKKLRAPIIRGRSLIIRKPLPCEDWCILGSTSKYGVLMDFKLINCAYMTYIHKFKTI